MEKDKRVCNSCGYKSSMKFETCPRCGAKEDFHDTGVPLPPSRTELYGLIKKQEDRVVKLEEKSEEEKK